MERIKQAMDVARMQREQLRNEYISSAERVGHQERNALMSEKNLFMDLKGNHAKLLLIAVIITSVVIFWWKVSSNRHDVMQLSDTEVLEYRQDSAAVEKMGMKIAALDERINSLTESITHLETKLISTHLTTDAIITVDTSQASRTTATRQTIAKTENMIETLPPPASGIPGNEANLALAPRLSTDEIVFDSSISTPTMEQKPPSTTSESAIKTNKNGPWVINLVSTSSKTDADRLTKKALSKDIPTEQQQITVKGKQYWRVQITGFSTPGDARAYADMAKEQLGLKDAWIMKR